MADKTIHIKIKQSRLLIILVVVLFLLTAVYLISSDWFWNAISPITYNNILQQYSEEFKIDPLLVAAIIKSESAFNPIAESNKGALGLMQLMPLTAEALAHEMNLDYVNVEDLYDPEINIHIGYYYIVKLLKKYNGNIVFALAAYNAGTVKTDEWLKNYKGDPDRAVVAISFPETQKFVKEVLSTYEMLKLMRKVKRTLQMRD